MKDYNKIIVLFCFFTGFISNAQYATFMYSNSWSFNLPMWEITNPGAILLRGTIIADQIEEKGVIDDHKKATRDFLLLEKEYQSKLSTESFSLSTSAFLGLSLTTVELTENKIQELLTDIRTTNAVAKNFKYGLGDMEGRLRKEQRYIDEIQDDYPWLAGSVVFGGGAGYTYTAVLKILIRCLEIKRNVYAIEKELKNLSVLNRTFVP